MSELTPLAIFPGTPAVALSVLMGLLLIAVIAWVDHVEQGRSYVPAIGRGTGTDQTEYVHGEKPGGLTFFALLLLGYAGMPRRYATYALGGVGPVDLFTVLQQVATIGAFLIGLTARRSPLPQRAPEVRLSVARRRE